MNADTYLPTLAERTYPQFGFHAETVAEARSWQRAWRATLTRLLGLDVIATHGSAPMTAERVAVYEEPDHIREAWRLETEPGFWLPFFLLKPRDTVAKHPLVLTPHGHGKAGKRMYAGLADDDEAREQMLSGERDIALQAVREGYLAIAPDMRGFASLRRQQEIDDDANNSCRHLQMHAYLFGRTLVGERVWDIQRLIDWAVQRDDVDASAIIITGNSGGGTVSLFAGAVDERIRVAIPASYFCTFKDSIGSIYHCECNYIPGILRYGEMADVAGLVAPRHFMAVNGKEDPIFPIAATQQSFARLQAIYQVFGAAERCKLSIGEGGHRYYKGDVWPFVKQAIETVRAPTVPA